MQPKQKRGSLKRHLLTAAFRMFDFLAIQVIGQPFSSDDTVTLDPYGPVVGEW